ncbi:MAG: hypothetical protein N2691_02410 [Patescibacteria group bacterium]|nr:hypothetical protein [Patescibacteria group bacterium]
MSLETVATSMQAYTDYHRLPNTKGPTLLSRSVPAYLPRSDYDKHDTIIAEGLACSGDLGTGEVCAVVLPAASPHANFFLPTEVMRQLFADLRRDGNNVVLPHETRKILCDKVPLHMNLFFQVGTGENDRGEVIDFTRIAFLPEKERRAFERALHGATVAVNRFFYAVYSNPKLRELAGLPSMDELSTQALMQSTPQFFLTGYVPEDQMLREGGDRGPQSNRRPHANRVPLLPRHVSASEVPATPRDVYKLTSPLEAVTFPLTRALLERTVARNGVNYRGHAVIDRGDFPRDPNRKPNFYGIWFEPERPVSHADAMELVFELLRIGEQIMEFGREAMGQWYKYGGSSTLDLFRKHWQERLQSITGEWYSPYAAHLFEELIIKELKPTYRMLYRWQEEFIQAHGKRSDRLNSLLERYSRARKNITDPNFVKKFRRLMAMKQNLDPVLADTLLLMLEDTYKDTLNEGARPNGEGLLIMPLRFGASVHLGLEDDTNGIALRGNEILVKSIWLNVGNSRRGFYESWMGSEVRREMGK